MDTEKEPCMCDVEGCDKIYKNLRNLTRHKKKKHENFKLIFSCEICEQTFCNRQNLDRHLENIHKDPRKEDIDLKINAVFVEEHMEPEKFKTWKGQRKMKHFCTYPGCTAKFDKPSKLERHFCMHTGERQYKCDFEDCDKAYTNSSYLKRHKLTHSGIKESFACDICGMTFSVIQNLKRHHHRKHDNPLKLFDRSKTCEICQAEFPTRKLLSAHAMEVHELKFYKCNLCDKRFSISTQLQRHLNSSIHSSYRCKICKINFSKFHELAEHNKEKHIVPYSEYSCDVCKMKVRSKVSLRQHLKTHVPPEIISCPYEDCHRIYYFKRNMDHHIRTYHLGQRWECPSCFDQLSSKQKLKEHIDKIHENPQPKKPHPTKENRKRRWDVGQPKKSAISHLVGIILPKKSETDIMYRHIEIENS